METRILIVDDNSLVRAGLRQMLQQHRHWRVCGEASDGRDALEKAKGSAPDLIVLDFLMPGMDGLEAARQLGEQLIEEARHAGIRGAVPKSDPRRLVEGVEAVLRNEPYFVSSSAREHAAGGESLENGWLPPPQS